MGTWRFRALTRAAVIALFWPLAACSAAFPAGATVEAADVRLNLLMDGSVEVRESFTVHFGDTPASSLTRAVSLPGVDDFIDTSAYLDGRQLLPDAGVDRATIARGQRLRVDWHFQPSANRTRAFVLIYRAVGVTALVGNRAEFQWDPRPAGGSAVTGPVRIEFTAPEHARFLTPAAMREAGWQVTTRADGLTAQRSSLAPQDRATVTAVLAADSLAAAEPAWQYNAERAGELMPAFLAGGPFILVVGLGILGLLRLQFPARPVAGAEDTSGRAEAARGLRVSGYVAIVLAGLTAGATAWLLPAYGWPPMAIPVSLALDGVMFIVAAARFPLGQ